MNTFFRKFILHKYSEQISALAKQPVFIISEDATASQELAETLNKHPNLQIAQHHAPLLLHIGNMAYEQYLGTEAAYYRECSQLKGDRLEEFLRKLSLKNTFGKDYGFNLNPLKRSQSKKLRNDMHSFRWGVQLRPDENAYKGLLHIFPNLKCIYLFTENADKNPLQYLHTTEVCKCIPAKEFNTNASATIRIILEFLNLEPTI